MKPMEVRNELLAQRVIKGLATRNMEGYYAKTKEEALEKALELINLKSSVSWGGSASAESIGLIEAIIQGDYKEINRASGETPEEVQALIRKSFSADYYITGTNAITEDGMLVNIDGSGNRVAALCFGPAYVIVIVGMNKVVKTESDAVSRARNIAAPINAQRFPLETPCKTTGNCMNCMSKDTICCQFVTTRYSRIPGRIKVILVNDNLGF